MFPVCRFLDCVRLLMLSCCGRRRGLFWGHSGHGAWHRAGGGI